MLESPTSAVLQTVPTTSSPNQVRQLNDFWVMNPAERLSVLLEAIGERHCWHFARNVAYRRAVEARGVGAAASQADLPRLLRPTAQTFKSYIEILGTPFPNDQPRAFVNWLADQLSIELPRQRFAHFRTRYSSMERLLEEIERRYADLGFEILTSSGTSGRSTILIRDHTAIDRTVESFYLSFQRYLGMQADHRAIFIMPQHTRIAMARMASFSFKRVGLAPDRIHFTIPFPASPDQVRIRTGRTYRPGWRGLLERRLWNPFMNWAGERYVMPSAIRQTICLLEFCELNCEKVLVFGGWVQLHALALELRARGRDIRLVPGSLLGTGGGFKEHYPYTPSQIRQDLAEMIVSKDGQPVPLRDVYGMAEANWAAMQCKAGNYHIPPWVYAVTLDQDDQIQYASDSTGLLAFYDPYGGGDLFPAFFKTTDRVRLVNGTGASEPTLDCPCGEAGIYITEGSIQRVDLVDEAGCAAQI